MNIWQEISSFSITSGWNVEAATPEEVLDLLLKNDLNPDTKWANQNPDVYNALVKFMKDLPRWAPNSKFIWRHAVNLAKREAPVEAEEWRQRVGVPDLGLYYSDCWDIPCLGNTNLQRLMNIAETVKPLIDRYNISLPLQQYVTVRSLLYRLIEIRNEVEEREAYRQAVEDFKNSDGWQNKEPLFVFGEKAGKYAGWWIGNVNNEHDARLEGLLMKHCIGDDRHPHYHRIREGRSHVVSLRDKEGIPHGTIEMTRDGQTITQGYGWSDHPLKSDYQKLFGVYFREKEGEDHDWFRKPEGGRTGQWANHAAVFDAQDGPPQPTAEELQTTIGADQFIEGIATNGTSVPYLLPAIPFQSFKEWGQFVDAISSAGPYGESLFDYVSHGGQYVRREWFEEYQGEFDITYNVLPLDLNWLSEQTFNAMIAKTVEAIETGESTKYEYITQRGQGRLDYHEFRNLENRDNNDPRLRGDTTIKVEPTHDNPTWQEIYYAAVGVQAIVKIKRTTLDGIQNWMDTVYPNKSYGLRYFCDILFGDFAETYNQQYEEEKGIPDSLHDNPYGQERLFPGYQYADPNYRVPATEPARESSVKWSETGWAGDAYPGQELDAQALNRDYSESMKMMDVQAPIDVKTWIIIGKDFKVSDEDDPEVALRSNGLLLKHYPHAYGQMFVEYNWSASFTIDASTLGVHLVMRFIRQYCKDNDLELTGIQDAHGNELSSLFSKKSSDPGSGPHTTDKLWVNTDSDLRTDIQREFPGKDTMHTQDEKLFTGIYECPDCHQQFENQRQLMEHIDRHPPNRPHKPDYDPVRDGLPDEDDVLPAGKNEAILPGWVGLMSHVAGEDAPGPIPFIYDIDGDRVYVGKPGQQHGEMEIGKFNQWSAVEGLYKPGGEVEIRTTTNMPYTVRHMIRLWYYMHPELEVKSVYLLYKDKKDKERKHRLAAAAPKEIGQAGLELMNSDPAAREVYSVLAPYGDVYIVGGAVRDLALGRTPKDVDLLVRGIEPEEVERLIKTQLPGKVALEGKAFGVFRYRDKAGFEVEVALPRRERSTGAGHKNFAVFVDPTMSIEDDLLRRDFTVNAMAIDVKRGELIDPYNGWEDAQSGILKTVSPQSFKDDPLRILRAIAAMSRFGLMPDEDTRRQMFEQAHTLDGTHEETDEETGEVKTVRDIPYERIQMELDKIMVGDHVAPAIDLSQQTGVLQYILPEVAAAKGFDQRNKYHNQELYDHLLSVLQVMSGLTKDPDLRLAALLHDIGKPASQWYDADIGLEQQPDWPDERGWAHYYKRHMEDGTQHGDDHQHVGADMAAVALRRLNYPNDRNSRIEHLIRHHMFDPFSDDKGARKFVNTVGTDHANDLLLLRRADANNKAMPWDGNFDQMHTLISQAQEVMQPLAIGGREVMQELGLKPGKEVGQHLQRLKQHVIEYPEDNIPERLIQLLHMASLHTASILDSIQDSLDPDVWESHGSNKPKLKPTIKTWIEKKIYGLLKKHGFKNPEETTTLVLTGSLTTYQWGEKSDLDVNLFIDYEAVPEIIRADIVSLMVENLDGTKVPGTRHPIQVFVATKEKGIDKKFKVGLRSGYDIEKDEWIVPPDRSRSRDVFVTMPHAIQYARMMEDKMRLLRKYNKPLADVMWDNIHQKRKTDQEAELGDYTESNIVYKWLANAGLDK